MEITSKPVLKWAAPMLAALDIERTISFYCSRLGFSRVYSYQGVWGIVSRDDAYIHFWACTERHIAENTSCRVYVTGVDGLYAQMQSGIVHPNAPLQDKAWARASLACSMKTAISSHLLNGRIPLET